LRNALWPSAKPANHQQDIERDFLQSGAAISAFVAMIEGDVAGLLKQAYLATTLTVQVVAGRLPEAICVAPAIRR
jgi:fructose-1,6-bisphosphatase/sedoheptulose 1,7-bisphosphatase-like protein